MKLFTMVTTLFFALSFGLFSSGNDDEAGHDNMNMAEADGVLMDFESMEKAMMLVETGPAVLFFNASWCPTCRSAVKDFEMNALELEGIHLLSVDYDDSADLKKKYDISYQHTFVQIDSMGNVLALWNGGGAKELLNNIKPVEM